MYYIRYKMIKKFSDFKNLHSINPSYLTIYSATGHFKEKYREKNLIVNSTKEYEKVWSGIKSEIKKLKGGKKLFYKKNYAEIGINTDDDFPLNKQLKFSKLTITIRCVLQKNEKLYQ